MSLVVVDANVVLRWLIPDQPFEAQAMAVRERHRCLAPTLILSEVANALWKYVRVGRIELAEAVEAVGALPGECALSDDRALIEAAQRLSAERDHPIYDCLYVALAMRKGAPLITADERLARKLAGTHGLQLTELSAVAI